MLVDVMGLWQPACVSLACQVSVSASIAEKRRAAPYKEGCLAAHT